ncbi:FHA domain-containing protein [Sulfurovum sp.]|uniref:FHA domain-containing protein n=1 Tax=Sulfurovum sp. TaxID=1969726 RepID=UPI0025DEBB36|nr:FHA domain-containing protein [Sulfurovum sp.]
MEDKQSLLNRVTPMAVLKAVTPEARGTMAKNCLDDELIGIWHFPFRIGRESRVENVDGKIVPSERQKISNGKPNNDIYLVDHRRFLQISRQHLRIEKTEAGYAVIDRGSACGTMVNAQKIGGEDRGGTCELQDGDIIKIGTEDSPYLFQFITLS